MTPDEIAATLIRLDAITNNTYRVRFVLPGGGFRTLDRADNLEDANESAQLVRKVISSAITNAILQSQQVTLSGGISGERLEEIRKKHADLVRLGGSSMPLSAELTDALEDLLKHVGQLQGVLHDVCQDVPDLTAMQRSAYHEGWKAGAALTKMNLVQAAEMYADEIGDDDADPWKMVSAVDAVDVPDPPTLT